MFGGQLSLPNNVCVSLCATDKIKRWFDDAVRKVTKDYFFFVGCGFSQGDAVQQGASCTRREPRRTFTQLQYHESAD